MSSMRMVHWLFVVSVALFVAGIGFVIASGRTAQARVPDDEAPPVVPVASVKQIMDGITGPAATVLYNAVGTIINTEGVKEIAPQTDEEWAVVGNSVAALVESGNLMMMEGRAVDNGDWITMSRAMIDAGVIALKAVEAKSTEAVLKAGEAVNKSCDACHERYQR
jgi:hypothetical protein